MAALGAGVLGAGDVGSGVFAPLESAWLSVRRFARDRVLYGNFKNVKNRLRSSFKARSWRCWKFSIVISSISGFLSCLVVCNLSKNMKFYFNFIAFTLFNSMMTHLFVSLTSGRLIFILDNSPSVKWQIIVINKSNLLSVLLWWMNIFFLEIYWNNKELMIESRLADIFIVNESMRRIRIYCRLGQCFCCLYFIISRTRTRYQMHNSAIETKADK